MNTNYLVNILLTGAGATAMTDLWAIVRRRVFGTPLPNFGFVGRWVAHLAQGQMRHDSISTAPPVRAERAIGWGTHYLIGMAFALLLPAFSGWDWVQHPTLMPALIVGIVTVAAPFLILQPGMGAGIAASRTPRPGAGRLQSLVTHAIFGLGLYLAALSISMISSGV